MKARPMKEWIFFVFIALGIACSLILPITVATYLDYAENGYGLEAEILDARLGNNDNLIVEMELTNPGKLDMQVYEIHIGLEEGSGSMIDGDIPTEIYDIEGKTTEEVTFSFDLNALQDLNVVVGAAAGGSLEYELRIDIYIPHRDAHTTLIQTGTMEVA